MVSPRFISWRMLQLVTRSLKIWKQRIYKFSVVVVRLDKIFQARISRVIIVRLICSHYKSNRSEHTALFNAQQISAVWCTFEASKYVLFTICYTNKMCFFRSTYSCLLDPVLLPVRESSVLLTSKKSVLQCFERVPKLSQVSNKMWSFVLWSTY